MNSKPVAVIVGASSKWQADGRNTVFVHGGKIEDRDLAPEVRWGVGGALALKFAAEGFFVVLTTRSSSNATGLADHITSSGGACSIVELDVGSWESVHAVMAQVATELGGPEIVIYNAGYMAGRELPADQELLEYFPNELFNVAVDVACRGPFYVAKAALPFMRERGTGSFFFSNNAFSLRGRKRKTGESLYYPRTLMRALSQSLTEEYSPLGVHVANVVIDGFIDSPGTRNLEAFNQHSELLVNPAAIAEAFFYLHQQDRSCWTHELQVTPAAQTVNY
jgi:NAD(P)-dependent dehydrogenase (short-subunit alcohol dehydrogenase family)